jgi:hypothetical protein
MHGIPETDPPLEKSAWFNFGLIWVPTPVAASLQLAGVARQVANLPPQFCDLPLDHAEKSWKKACCGCNDKCLETNYSGLGALLVSKWVRAEKGDRAMIDLLSKFDAGELLGLVLGLVAVTGGLLCGIVGIIAGSWQTVRRAEITAALKHDMLNRGMSAEEIQTVLEAGSKGSRRDFRSRHCG